MSHSYTEADLVLSPEQMPWRPSAIRHLAKWIFDTSFDWSRASTAIPIPVTGRLHRRSEGRSGVDVHQLDYRRKSDGEVLRRFIIRTHVGERAAQEAQAERDYIARLRLATPSCFSCDVLPVSPDLPDAVVLRHTDDQSGEPLVGLHAVVHGVVASRDDGPLERLAGSLSRFMKSVTATYDSLATASTTSATNYFEQEIRPRMAPELVIDARSLDADPATRPELADGVLKLARPTGECVRTAALVPADELMRRVADTPWICCNVTVEYVLPQASGGIVKLRADDLRLWLRLGPETTKLLEQRRNELDRLIFHTHEGTVTTGSGALQARGYGATACPDPATVRRWCDNLEAVQTKDRHGDLHCENVRASITQQVVIDVGGRRAGLRAIDRARLETDLWRRTADEVEEDEARTILDHLRSGVRPRQDELGRSGWVLYCLLEGIRKGAESGGDGCPVPAVEEALAYATEILIFQRYLLEDEQDREASAAEAAAAAYWLARLAELAAGRDIGVRSVAPVPAAPAPPAPWICPDGSMAALWTEALTSVDGEGREPALSGDASLFLSAARMRDPESLELPLTELQQAILDQARAATSQQHPDEHPFHSDRHVIITAPTSTGKSKVAEMFLVRPHMVNATLKRSLYIAPTRALAQAKHRDLETLCKGTALEGRVVLSTGEDVKHDWRFVHGDFDIACMVYEKANVLFSRNRKLFYGLGCVVIDESHMLSNLDRGPMLELLLTKVVDWRRERADATSSPQGDGRRERLRIVAISTEDKADPGLATFLSVRNPLLDFDELPPLVLRGRQRPFQIRHSLLLPDAHAPYRFYTFAELGPGDARTLSPERIGEIDTELAPFMQAARAASRQAGLAPLIEARNERTQRLLAYLIAVLRDGPSGTAGGLQPQRILVFVPGRAPLEQIASALRKRRTAAPIRVTPSLETALNDQEDPEAAKLLRECAAASIFIHHADIHPTVRHAIEELCADPVVPGAPSQVVFATETLSYGVNLAIDTVVLLGTSFPSADRMRKPMPNGRPLPISAFHNMVGRVARLGKGVRTGPADVCVVVAIDDRPRQQILESYYRRVAAVESQLFVQEDKHVFIRSASDGQPTATSLSYPFLRSVLDVLRYLNVPEKREDKPEPQTAGAVRDFLRRTLYDKQKLTPPTQPDAPTIDPRQFGRELELLTRGIDTVLRGCAEQKLPLVERVGDARYLLTELGKAIIDTGTEIITVEPLMELTHRVREVWNSLPSEQPFPSDLYVLCLVALDEILRQHIAATPELNQAHYWTDMMRDANRETVFATFTSSVSRLVGWVGEPRGRQLASGLREMLEQWPSRLKVPYDHAAADGIMRLFNGLVAWIEGRRQSDAAAMIERYGSQAEGLNNERGARISWRPFTEELHYKAIFLNTLLDNLPAVNSTELQRNLYLLAQRLRLGCTVEAIPLIQDRTTKVHRLEADQLIKLGITPARILSGAQLPTVPGHGGIGAKLPGLLKGLARYAVNEFQELATESATAHALNHRQVTVRDLWTRLKETHYDKSVASFHRPRLKEAHNDESVTSFHLSTGDPIGFDGLLRQYLDFTRIDHDGGGLPLDPAGRAAQDPELVIATSLSDRQPGVEWKVHVRMPADEDGTTTSRSLAPFRIVGVELRADWKVSVGRRWTTFAALLAKLTECRQLVLVALPWLPLVSDLPDDAVEALRVRATLGMRTTIASTAALGVAMSAIVRKFASNTEALLQLLSGEPARDRAAQDQGPTLSRADDLPALFDGVHLRFLGVKEVQQALARGDVPEPILEKVIRHFEVRPPTA